MNPFAKLFYSGSLRIFRIVFMIETRLDYSRYIVQKSNYEETKWKYLLTIKSHSESCEVYF